MSTEKKLKILPFDKIYSVISYLTMGIAGLILVLIAYMAKKRLRYFLNYNIAQSVLLGIILAIFKFILNNVLFLIAKIPFLDGICAIINLLFTTKIIKLGILSFNTLEFFVVILITYISIGIFRNKILPVPLLTNLTQTATKTLYK